MFKVKNLFLFLFLFVYIFCASGDCFASVKQKAQPDSILVVEESGNKISLDIGILLESMQIAATYHLDRSRFDKKQIVDGMINGFLSSMTSKQRSRLYNLSERSGVKVTIYANELRLSVKSQDGLELTIDATKLLYLLKLSVANKILDRKTDCTRLIEYIAEGFMQSLDSHSHYLNEREAKGFIGELESKDNISCDLITKNREKILVIRITGFSEDTAVEFEAAIAKYKNEKNLRVIFDLRDNRGGLDSSTERMLGIIVGGGRMLLSEEYYTGKTEKIYSDKKIGKGIGISWKIFCLVNGGTASNAEVFPAALHDILGAKIIGERTYGKGVGGHTIPLDSGRGACIVTYTRWYTPSGKCIEGIGLTPDIEVRSRDRQMEKAIEQLLKK